MKTVAIIPALNEYTQLQEVINCAVNFVDAVIVVDDGSNTPLNSHVQLPERATIVRHSINLGKGASLKTGVIWALRHGFDIAVFLDADGQHDPNEIPRLIKPIINTNAEIVFGVRSFQKNMPFISRLGNTLLTRIVQLLYSIRVDDTQSGFRALLLSSFDKISWKSARYAVETEMIVNTGKKSVPYAQVPISTIYHDKYKGTTVIDGIRIFVDMVMWKLI